MFYCQVLRKPQRALLAFLVGAFLLASLPRVEEFSARSSAASESQFIKSGEFLDGFIGGRASKKNNLQTESRLLTVHVRNQVRRSTNFVRVADRGNVYSDPPAAGSLLIRSPPSDSVP